MGLPCSPVRTKNRVPRKGWKQFDDKIYSLLAPAHIPAELLDLRGYRRYTLLNRGCHELYERLRITLLEKLSHNSLGTVVLDIIHPRNVMVDDVVVVAA